MKNLYCSPIPKSVYRFNKPESTLHGHLQSVLINVYAPLIDVFKDCVYFSEFNFEKTKDKLQLRKDSLTHSTQGR